MGWTWTRRRPCLRSCAPPHCWGGSPPRISTIPKIFSWWSSQNILEYFTLDPKKPPFNWLLAKLTKKRIKNARIWNHLPDRHLQNCSSVLPVVVAQEGHVGQEQLFHLKKREVARGWCCWQWQWERWWWWWSCRITNKTVVCLCIRPNKRTFDMMWRWIVGIPLSFFNRGLSGLCRKYCPVKFSWQRTYGAAHPQAFVSCLKARLSEENIFCIDCFELRLEIIRSSSVTFFHPKLYHILPVVHIVILNISALYNFICIIAKYIQPPNRDWMENVWRQKRENFSLGCLFLSQW